MSVVDKDVRILVEGAGEASGIYKIIGTKDGTGVYALDGTDFRLQRIDYFGGKSWCIYANQEVWFAAPLSSTDPKYPPSTDWSRSPKTNDMESVPMATLMTVRKPCALIYEKLLLSEDYSDATIICEDGVPIPVHKAILAASSSYFKAAFSGEWTENQSGVIKTVHPAHIVKETLSLIYTGGTSSKLIKEAPLAFISVASEFDIPWLKKLVEPNCVKTLDQCSLKAVWQAGHLYESELLKKACIEYAKKNPLLVLANSSIIDLKSEDPASWEEFSKAIILSH
jgi:hypothetical protein